MSQLPLFSQKVDLSPASIDQRVTIDDSASLLTMFESVRMAEGAHPRSVKREVSQLRALVREARAVVTTATIRTLFGEPGLLAQVLREPTTMIARSTGRAHLLAAQRFIQVVAPSLGHDPAADLAALDAQLPTRRSSGWHMTGTLVAGAAGRRRRRGPTLDAADLRRLVEAAGVEGGPYLHRNRALVALHCFSGLRPEEIIRLRWEDLDAELTAGGRFGLTAVVERGVRRVRLLLPGPAEMEIEALATSIEKLATCGPVLSCALGVGQSTRSATVQLGMCWKKPAVESVCHPLTRPRSAPPVHTGSGAGGSRIMRWRP